MKSQDVKTRIFLVDCLAFNLSHFVNETKSYLTILYCAFLSQALCWGSVPLRSRTRKHLPKIL